MIERALIPLILFILVPYLYIDYRYMRRLRWWQRLLWWVPALVLIGFGIYLSTLPDFLPPNPTPVFLYLLALGLIVAPKFAWSLCSLCGHVYCRLFHKRRNYGNLVGLLAVVGVLYVVLYGSFVGVKQMQVNHMELAFEDLPDAFDGYRIVQFSDIHLGSMTGFRADMVRRAVDSINAQHPDAIVFTGDIQNTSPSEIRPHLKTLARLKAKDGIFSVRGNHDYDYYIDGDMNRHADNMYETVGRQYELKWRPLLNAHHKIRRGKDRIVIAGLENDDEGRFPQLANLGNALNGLSRNDFVVMLEHDPSAWRRKILPHSHAQLTLSGHTHGGQFRLFGWAPVSLHYQECCGLYTAGPRMLYVSAGLGGLLPFRFGIKGEIDVIVLRKAKTEK